MLGVIGKKLGMTRLYDAVGEIIPVTVIETLPGVVVRKKTEEADGYSAVQIGYEDKKKKHVNKPEKGYFAKQNLSPKKTLKEYRVSDLESYEIGQEINGVSLFKAGSFVDVSGTTKGKGFAGVVKRHGFSRGPETHGSRHHREPGSVGSTGPSRVLKGLRLPGRKGNKTFTVQNLKVIKVDSRSGLIFVRGAIPGNRFGHVVMKPAIKKQSK